MVGTSSTDWFWQMRRWRMIDAPKSRVDVEDLVRRALSNFAGAVNDQLRPAVRFLEQPATRTGRPPLQLGGVAWLADEDLDIQSEVLWIRRVEPRTAVVSAIAEEQHDLDLSSNILHWHRVSDPAPPGCPSNPPHSRDHKRPKPPAVALSHGAGRCPAKREGVF